MVANPMQRKARNSFLLGMLITLVICLLIFALFYLLVINKEKKEEKEKGEKVIAYVLNQDVQSGDVITADLLTEIEVYATMIPSNYVNPTQLGNLSLQDEKGNMLFTDLKGQLYIVNDENKQFVTTTDENKENKDELVVIKQDEQGLYKTRTTGEKEYIEVNGQTIVTCSNGEKCIVQKDNIKYMTTGEKDKENRMLIQEDQEGFYKTKANGEREYIKFINVPVVAKIDMYQNTVVTLDALSDMDNIVTDDTRYVEYNMLMLPTTIYEGDYIDIRLTLPNGQDLIVVSKKEVKSILGDTIGLELTEGEIVMMESAIVEAYIMTASKLYAVQYVEPGIQAAAMKTYTPTAEVQVLIGKNPNITTIAKNQLKSKFDGDIRTLTESSKIPYVEADEVKSNLEEGFEQEIKNAKAAREAYLSGLTSY